MDVRGKVALVTGGAIRVGRAVSLALAGAGAEIVFSYNSSAGEAAATAAEIVTMGSGVLAVHADQSQGDQIQALVDAAVAKFGRLDILVNSASLWRRTPWSDLDEAAWDQLLDINLKGPFLCARAAAPHLAAHGDGAIVNIVDLSAWLPFPNFAPHSAAKAGLLNLTDSLAMELAPAVRVNAVSPGPVMPPPEYSPEQIAAAARRTLLGRWGTAEDVSQAVLYLVRADFVTGAVIHVNGGEHLAWRKK